MLRQVARLLAGWGFGQTVRLKLSRLDASLDEVTCGRSEVVVTLTVSDAGSDPGDGGLIRLLKVMLSGVLAATFWPLKITHVSTCPTSLQLPPTSLGAAGLVTSLTDELAKCVKSVPAGNVTEIVLCALPDSPPVEDVVNPTV